MFVRANEGGEGSFLCDGTVVSIVNCNYLQLYAKSAELTAGILKYIFAIYLAIIKVHF